MPTSTPVSVTFGQTVAQAVKQQKAAFEKEGRVYKLADLAAMVDALLPSYLERYPYQSATFALESPTAAKESKSSPFGDPKVIPPSPAQVAAYSASIGYPMDGQAWCDEYEKKGWMVGRTRMKNWHCAVRSWKTNRWGQNGIALSPAKVAPAQRDYSKI